jgi:MobA/MobL family
MAQFRFSAAIVSRSSGQSVVASAAYRAGQKLRDERTGDIKDYTRRAWSVLYTQILTPENAPRWMLDRQTLWNQAEHREDSSTRRHQAQLARDIELPLPHELTHEQRVELVCEFVKAEFVNLGMVADIAIHAPPKRGDGTNHHAHVLLTMRDIEEDGFGDKNRDWNQKPLIELWRERWADYQNRALEKYGHEARVDHRSLEDQGIDREPTTHLGPGAQGMEDRGIKSDRGDENRRRQTANDNRKELKAHLADINRQIAELERLQTIVGAVEGGYQRVEQSAQPKPQNADSDLEKRPPQSYAHAPEAFPMPDAQSDRDSIVDEAIRKEDERQEQARKDQDKLQNDLIAADKKLKELGQIYREAQELRERLIKQSRELDVANDRFEQLQEQRQRESERRRESEPQENPYLEYAHEKEVRIEDRRQEIIEKRDRQYLEGDIRNAGDRYSQALHNNYDFGDPYMSFAKVAIAEYASFRGEQNALSAEIAKATDPKLREALETRRKIEGYEYLMVTGERIAVQSELITGRKNSEEAVKMRERINVQFIKDENGNRIAFPGYTQEAENLRFNYRELQAERAAAPAKPQSTVEKVLADARSNTPESAATDKQQQRPKSAVDKVLEDAKRHTPAPNKFQDLDKTKTPDPQKGKDQLNQQERERQAQKDRDRER